MRRGVAFRPPAAAAYSLEMMLWLRLNDLPTLETAIRSFARTWTADLKERHIRVNVISSATIDWRVHRRSKGSQGSVRLDHPDGTHWPTALDRSGGTFSDLRGFQFRHRRRAICRWRNRADIAARNHLWRLRDEVSYALESYDRP
jgi:NAD(P)-dependent dehydrogenase (short-subunit alcohol dehydrogenase family)